MWNFIVIISPFTISIKKVRLLYIHIFPEFFFAIKIHSFHAALNSDAPRLEFVLYMGNELGEVRIPPYLFVVYHKVYLMMKKKSSRFLKKKLGTDHPAPPTHKYFLRNSQSWINGLKIFSFSRRIFPGRRSLNDSGMHCTSITKSA